MKRLATPWGHIALLLLSFFLASCQRGPEVAPGELETIEHPDLTDAEKTIQEQIGQARRDLEAAQQGAKDRRELAEAFGSLGELYHAYDLDSAAACYRNATKLDPASFLWPYYLGVLGQENAELDSAKEWFEQALERRNNEPTALLRLGEIFLAQGDAQAATKRFQEVLGKEGFAAAAHYGLGRAAADQGQTEEAVEHFEKALAIAPQAGAIHHPLGLAYRQLERPQEAEEHLGQQGSGEPSFPDRVMNRLEGLATSSGAYLKRGSRDLVNGDFDGAQKALQKAVEVDPTNSSAHRNLAHALLQKGARNDALEALKSAAETLPEDAWIHFDLGNLFLANALPQQAVKSFSRAVELVPDFVQAHFNLANTLVGLERWQEAEKHTKVVLQEEPKHKRARLLDARIKSSMGRWKRATEALQALLEEEPADLAARQELSKAFERINRLADAATVYRDALELDLSNEDKLSLHLALGELFWRRNKRQDALGWWRRGAEQSPDSSKAHTALANALQLTGKYEEARGSFARAVEIDPENSTAWLSEASLWLLDSKFDIAKERLEEALRRHPDHPGLNNTMARLLSTCNDPNLRDGQRALELARKAFTIENSIDHAETMAMAMAELGQFEEAIKWQRSLATRAAASNDRAVMSRLVQRVRLYESRRPVRIGE